MRRVVAIVETCLMLCPSGDTMRDVRKDNTTKSTYDLVGQGSRCAEC